MPKRKNILNFVFNIIEGLAPIYVLLMISWWYTNKTAFYKWFFYVIIFFAIIIIFGIWRRKERFKNVQGFLSDRELLLKLREMRPTEFEDYVAELFSKLGYKTKAVGGGHDRGIDVIAEKEGIKHYIQCKKFITSQVGVADVRDFYGAIADHVAQGKGYLITTNKFTLEAEEFAEDKPIELIDGHKLIGYIRLAERENHVLSKTTEKCPKCGGSLIERKGKYGKFYGCSNYPKCEYTKNIK